MHSLDGKAKTVRYRIAEDMNALSQDDSVNIYDNIQECASIIASVGDSTPKPIMGVQDDNCHNCGEKGHHAHNCPHEDKKDKDKDRQNGKSKQKCTHYGWKGHTVDECRKKAREDATAVAAVNAVHAAQASQQPDAQPSNSSQCAPVTQSTLAAYLASLSPGGSGSGSGSAPGSGRGSSSAISHQQDYEQAEQVLFTQQATSVMHGSANDLQSSLHSSPASLPDAVSLLLSNAGLSHHQLSFQREMICARSMNLLEMKNSRSYRTHTSRDGTLLCTQATTLIA